MDVFTSAGESVEATPSEATLKQVFDDTSTLVSSGSILTSEREREREQSDYDHMQPANQMDLQHDVGVTER